MHIAVVVEVKLRSSIVDDISSLSSCKLSKFRGLEKGIFIFLLLSLFIYEAQHFASAHKKRVV